MRLFRNVSLKGGSGGSLPIQNFLIRKNLAIQTVCVWGGGLPSFGETPKKYFVMPPLNRQLQIPVK